MAWLEAERALALLWVVWPEIEAVASKSAAPGAYVVSIGLTR